MTRILRAATALLVLSPGLLLAAPDIELQVTVDVPVPAAGQPVQFTVTARNVSAEVAAAVQVTDQLPAGLTIPAGLAAFPSLGAYDADTGVWSVGSLAPEASATLLIPAVVAVTEQPPCIVNVARLTDTPDSNSSNNRASAAVRRSVADRCVDLSASVENFYVPSCVTSNTISTLVPVRNAGPDTATNLLVDLSQDPTLAPQLRLTGATGTTGATCSGTRCTIPSLEAGERFDLAAISDRFFNDTQRAVTLGVAASSNETDHATTNNQSSLTVVLPAVSPKCDEIEVDEGWGVGAGGCFIATAAYGSELEPHVMALRDFRDRYLRQNAAGRAFIRAYYRHSPPVAALIARHESLRSVARIVLTPLVLAVAHPHQALAVLTLLGAFLAGRTRRGQRVVSSLRSLS